jgi:hypothetical protein
MCSGAFAAMATSIQFFMTQEDEIAFVRYLGRFQLEVYPLRVPPNWKPFVAHEETWEKLPADVSYLAASTLGPVLVDKVKRGPDKGAWRVDEVRSPVIYFERSRINEEDELASGRLWAGLEWTPQTGRRYAAPDRFRSLFQEIEHQLRKTFRKSEPKGFLIGPHAARANKVGLILRNSEHRGGIVHPYR